MSFNIIIENVPAIVYAFFQTAEFPSGFLNTAYTMYGFEAINGQYSVPYTPSCGFFYSKTFNVAYVLESGTVATSDDCSTTGGSVNGIWQFELQITSASASTWWRVFAKQRVSGPVGVANFIENRGFGTPFLLSTSGAFCSATEQSPIATTNSLTYLGRTTPFWNPGGYFLGDGGTGCITGEEFVTSKAWPEYSQQSSKAITGWRYVVSDIPEFVDVRAFSTTVYRVQGLDAYNGTYDVARDEDLDCAAGLQQFQLNLTAEQYDITTSTPCLETPIPGGTKDVLATLTIPPRQSNKAILNLVIDGVGTFSYALSDDWDSYACGPQTETLTEADPCLTHTGDWLTIESSAILG